MRKVFFYTEYLISRPWAYDKEDRRRLLWATFKRASWNPPLFSGYFAASSLIFKIFISFFTSCSWNRLVFLNWIYTSPCNPRPATARVSAAAIAPVAAPFRGETKQNDAIHLIIFHKMLRIKHLQHKCELSPKGHLYTLLQHPYSHSCIAPSLRPITPFNDAWNLLRSICANHGLHNLFVRKMLKWPLPPPAVIAGCRPHESWQEENVVETGIRLPTKSGLSTNYKSAKNLIRV